VLTSVFKNFPNVLVFFFAGESMGGSEIQANTDVHTSDLYPGRIYREVRNSLVFVFFGML